MATQSAFTLQASFTHSYADGCHERSQPAHQQDDNHLHTLMAHQEQFRVQYLVQGHFDMRTGGAGDRTADLT